ncbi:MAG: hypothetical protein V1850_07770 [Candidatus Bathyarchaeota archaeon]
MPFSARLKLGEYAAPTPPTMLPAPPLARPTLEALPAPSAPPAPPEIPALRRATSNSYQPSAPSIAKRLFRSTLS